MIQCNVTVCGRIVSSAEERTSKDGHPFMAFAIVVPIQGRDQSVKELHINVAAASDPARVGEYTTGRRVTVGGPMFCRKKDDVIYYNLRAEKPIEINETTIPDCIEGTMLFRGKISKRGVEDKKSKKGNDFQTFSAFSSDKDGEKREFTWVEFANFSPIHADYLKAEAYVEVTGDLQLDVYKNNLQLRCIVKKAAPWIFSTNGNTAPQPVQ